MDGDEDGGLIQDRIDIRYVYTDGVRDAEYRNLLVCLSIEEQGRASRFLRLEDSISFAAGRVLVRKIVSAYLGGASASWRFLADEHGKPELVRAAGRPDVRFNISHSEGILVAAFTLGRDIGIDVEKIFTGLNVLDIARSHFAAAEISALESFSGENQRDEFFKWWTLKEAYVKAVGKGLSLSLSGFSFSLNPPAIMFPGSSLEDSDRWFFLQNHLSPEYIMAIAARRQPGEELDCTQRQVNFGDLLSPEPLR